MKMVQLIRIHDTNKNIATDFLNEWMFYVCKTMIILEISMIYYFCFDGKIIQYLVIWDNPINHQRKNSNVIPTYGGLLLRLIWAIDPFHPYLISIWNVCRNNGSYLWDVRYISMILIWAIFFSIMDIIGYILNLVIYWCLKLIANSWNFNPISRDVGSMTSTCLNWNGMCRIIDVIPINLLNTKVNTIS